MPKVAAMKTRMAKVAAMKTPMAKVAAMKTMKVTKNQAKKKDQNKVTKKGQSKPMTNLPMKFWAANSAPFGHPVLWQGLPKLDLGPLSEPIGSLPGVPDFLA